MPYRIEIEVFEGNYGELQKRNRHVGVPQVLPDVGDLSWM